MLSQQKTINTEKVNKILKNSQWMVIPQDLVYQ